MLCSVKYRIMLDHVVSEPIVSKCRLQNICHFVDASMCLNVFSHQIAWYTSEKEILGDLTHEIQALNRKVVSSQGLYSQKKKDGQQLQKGKYYGDVT